MQQPLMFIKVVGRDDEAAHAIINLANVVYMEGIDDTGQTRIYTASGTIVIDAPWDSFIDDVRRLMRENHDYALAASVALQDRMVEKLTNLHGHSH